MPLLDIEVSSIEEGVNRYQFSPAPEELDLEEEGSLFHNRVSIEAKITRTGDTLVLEGVALARVERRCARCLESFEEELNTSYYEVVQLDGDEVRVIDDQYDGDPGFLSLSPGIITIDPLVRESVLVSSPMKPICRAECKGLCAVCGANRNEIKCDCVVENIHPAWRALSDLKEDLEKKE